MAKLTLKQQDDIVCARKARKLVKRIHTLLSRVAPEVLNLVTEDFMEDQFTVNDDLKRISSLLMWADD